MGALFAGVFRSLAQSKEGQDALGMLLMLILVAPAIVGVALGVSSMERRLPNSMAMWIAAIWNGIILAGFFLLVIVGLMAK